MTRESRLLSVLADGHFRDAAAIGALLRPERWATHEIECLLEDLVSRRYVTDATSSGRRGTATGVEYAIAPEGVLELRRRALPRSA